MTHRSVNSMLNSVFSNLRVDYVTGNDTMVLRSPVETWMTMLQSVKIFSVKPGMTILEYVLYKV